MSSMDFDYTETSLASPSGSGRKRGDNFLNTITCERLRHWIGVGERQRAWCHNFLPTALFFRNRPRLFPWPAGAGFSAGVRQLHTGHASLLVNELNDSAQHLDVAVGPDAEVVRTDAPLGKDRRCFGQH